MVWLRLCQKKTSCKRVKWHDVLMTFRLMAICLFASTVQQTPQPERTLFAFSGLKVAPYQFLSFRSGVWPQCKKHPFSDRFLLFGYPSFNFIDLWKRMLDMYTQTRSPYLPPNYTPRYSSAVDKMIQKWMRMFTFVFVVVPFCTLTSTLILDIEINRDAATSTTTTIPAHDDADDAPHHKHAEHDSEPAWVNIVKGNNTNKQSCGPSFCFSAGSADCFAKNPAPMCFVG